MQTNSYILSHSLRICSQMGWREAIVINLISEFAFKPKQMRFIVKSYWQHIRCNSETDNGKLLSDPYYVSHLRYNCIQ